MRFAFAWGLAAGAAAALASCAGPRRAASPGPASVQGEAEAGARTVELSRPQIEALQSALAGRGFEVQRTGLLDGPTRGALATFQRARGLPASGLPDAPTLEALDLDPAQATPGG